MSDAPPQLGDIPQYSEMNIPTLSSTNGTTANHNTPTANGSSTMENVKATVYNNSQSAFDTVSNHPLTQNLKETTRNIKDTVSQGPVAENVKDQSAKTSSEFRNLADARTTPTTKAATGQPLTHYHSFFYNLLSWENPRATALSFVGTVLFIFAARYLPALRWSFKVLYITLGAAAAAEVAGKLVFSQGLASSFRPKKYYTIPRESLEASLEDVEQLINFFVIEIQRVLFAENVLYTGAAFVAAFASYWLIKFLPFWGLSLIGVSVMYLAPLIYITNKELIDSQISNCSNIVNSQANQVKDIAAHHTARATETAKQYAGDYSAKASEYIGGAKSTISSKTTGNAPLKSEPGVPPSTYSSEDFPHAPKQEPTPGVTSHQERYENSEFGGQAQLAS